MNMKIKAYFQAQGRDTLTGAIIPLWLHHVTIGGLWIAVIGVFVDILGNL